LLQGISVNPASSYSIEMNLLTLTIGTSTVNQSVSARIFTAVPAVITCRAENKLVPAVFAQSDIYFANALLTVDTNRRPKQMIQALQRKGDALF
jgi:hypothetical protein